ncbi:MAG: NAD(P)-dependent oxidoreductase, partial [Ferruginibacter sp.]
NIGRSGTLDESALYNLLNTGQLKAAALDVFETEPLPPNHISWTTKNLLISPHMSRSREIHAPFIFESLFEENFNRYIKQQPLLNIVDSTKGY